MASHALSSRQSFSGPGCEIATLGVRLACPVPSRHTHTTERAPRRVRRCRRSRRWSVLIEIGTPRPRKSMTPALMKELSVRKPNPPATPRATVSTRPECLGTPEVGIPVLLHGPLSEQCFRVLPLIGSRWLARGWGRVLRFNDLRGGTTWQQLKPLSGSA
jgi:hypothetical protein